MAKHSGNSTLLLLQGPPQHHLSSSPQLQLPTLPTLTTLQIPWILVPRRVLRLLWLQVPLLTTLRTDFPSTLQPPLQDMQRAITGALTLLFSTLYKHQFPDTSLTYHALKSHLCLLRPALDTIKQGQVLFLTIDPQTIPAPTHPVPSTHKQCLPLQLATPFHTPV